MDLHSTSESVSADAPITENEGLFCPSCEYSLVGLTSQPCPECGYAIDAATLRRLASLEACDATPWDDDTGLVGFCKTFWGAMWPGSDYMEQFPLRCRTGRAWQYSVVCYVLAAGAFSLPLARHGGDGALVSVIVLPGAMLGALATESLIAAVLALLPAVRAPNRSRQKSLWRGWGHYTSGFIVLSAFGGMLAIREEMVAAESWTPRGPPSQPSRLGWLLMGVSFVWWITVWCLFILSRARPGFRRVLALIAVPLLGLTGIVLGFIGVWFAGLFLMLVSD